MTLIIIGGLILIAASLFFMWLAYSVGYTQGREGKATRRPLTQPRNGISRGQREDRKEINV